jgi:hypothetical protein
MKQCVQCHQELSLDLFYKNSANKDGKMRVCKSCSLEKSKAYHAKNRAKRREYRQSVKDHAETVRIDRHTAVKEDAEKYSQYLAKERNRYLIYKYNIDQDRYNAMRKEQDYRCAICGVHENDTPKVAAFSQETSLYVDHCHTTGSVRKLLCMFCNSMLGKARESTDTLQKAIDYLKEFKK